MGESGPVLHQSIVQIGVTEDVGEDLLGFSTDLLRALTLLIAGRCERGGCFRFGCGCCFLGFRCRRGGCCFVSGKLAGGLCRFRGGGGCGVVTVGGCGINPVAGGFCRFGGRLRLGCGSRCFVYSKLAGGLCRFRCILHDQGFCRCVGGVLGDLVLGGGIGCGGGDLGEVQNLCRGRGRVFGGFTE